MRRKANIIIHNLPESTEEQSADKKNYDLKKANELISDGSVRSNDYQTNQTWRQRSEPAEQAKADNGNLGPAG